MPTTLADSSPLTLGILETGRPPDNLAETHGSYVDMAADWLVGFGAKTQTYAVMDGTFPQSPQDADLWLITGSKCGVYEDHPWLTPLGDFIRATHAAKSKMIGICFGHQIIAQAMGGTVAKSDKGWGLGVHHYSTLHETLPTSLALNAFHQDQIIAKPPVATCVATSGFCRYAALIYPGFAFTIQPHPEFDERYTSALLQSRRGVVLSDANTDTALETLSTPTNRADLARCIQNWHENGFKG